MSTGNSCHFELKDVMAIVSVPRTRSVLEQAALLWKRVLKWRNAGSHCGDTAVKVAKMGPMHVHAWQNASALGKWPVP